MAPDAVTTAHAAALAVGGALRDPARLPGRRGPLIGEPSADDLPWRPSSLGGGHAGIALFAGWLDASTPGEGWDDVAHRHLAAAIADPAALGRLGPSLYDGWGGLVLVAHFLARGGRRYRGFLEQADAALAAGAHRLAAEVEGLPARVPPPMIDVVSGLAGIAAVLLLRRGRTEIDAALDVALRALVRLPDDAGGGPRVAAEAEWGRIVGGELAPAPVVNLGLAHGVPGPIAALAVARREGAVVDGLDDALAQLVELLERHRADDDRGPTWPNAVALVPGTAGVATRARARMAWCYGAPGCARALWLAGEALDRDDWRRTARAAICAALACPSGERGIPSAPFCHGRAGLAHIALRFAAETGDPELAAQASAEVARLAAEHDPARRFGYVRIDSLGRPCDDPGLLDGAAGVGLVLASAAHDLAPAWDRAFLLG